MSHLQTHIDTHDLDEPMKSANRAQHSTETALSCVYNDFSRAIDNQKAVLLVMLDLSAAFDTVDRKKKILLQRVANEFGIVGTVQQWIFSYLDNRSFRVTVDGTYSKDILLQHGLPQGPCIGPLGFVSYTHTVGHIIRHHQLMYHIYADDIQIYLPVYPTVPGDVVCGMFKISRCVEDINSWMIRHKLKLNPDKTEFFTVSFSNHKTVLHDVSFHIVDDIIPQSSTLRNLGVVFDQQMNMDQYISKLCQTINWQIRNLYRIRRYIDQETCANIVRAMLLSRLDSCNVLFNNIAQRDLDRLQRLQNKCARLVFMPLGRTNISPIFKKLHWLRIKDRISFKTLLYVYKSLNGLFPRYIDACLTVKRPWEGSVKTPTDHGFNLRVPRSNKCAGDRAFSVAAPLKWNTIPIHIRSAPSVTIFKSHLKTNLYS